MTAAVLMKILQNCAIKNGTILRESRQSDFCEPWASKHVLQQNGMHECVCVHVVRVWAREQWGRNAYYTSFSADE